MDIPAIGEGNINDTDESQKGPGCDPFAGDAQDGAKQAGNELAPAQPKQRGLYANMDVSAMGVDVDAGPETSLGSRKAEEEEDPQATAVVVRRSRRGRSGRAEVQADDLPAGWERHQDELGPYYWQVRSGHIQRQAPVAAEKGEEASANSLVMEARRSRIFDEDFLPAPADCPEKANSVEGEKRNQAGGGLAPSGFLVVQVERLGTVGLEGSDLTTEKSSKAVNSCIEELCSSLTRKEEEEPLILELSEGCLNLKAPASGDTVTSQPVHTIRVWGVGRDNSFAYVARDKGAPAASYSCHVFRCSVPARIVANALKETCKRILIERSAAGGAFRREGGGKGSRARPVSMFCSSGWQGSPEQPATPIPPVEEPSKMVKVLYLGEVEVPKPCGINMLQEAIAELASATPENEWRPAKVRVSPSTVTISQEEDGGGGRKQVECRVRFLSFLGLGRDPSQVGFVVHMARDKFVAHVFHSEASAALLCRTVEAACKMRYQKCLDARPLADGGGISAKATGGGKDWLWQKSTSVSSSIKSWLDGWTRKGLSS